MQPSSNTRPATSHHPAANAQDSSDTESLPYAPRRNSLPASAPASPPPPPLSPLTPTPEDTLAGDAAPQPPRSTTAQTARPAPSQAPDNRAPERASTNFAKPPSMSASMSTTSSAGGGGGGGGVRGAVGKVEAAVFAAGGSGGGGGGGMRSLDLSPPGDVVCAETLASGFLERLVEQRRRDLLARGERLTIMCIGERGSGKTSLAQSLFVQEIPKKAPAPKGRAGGEIEERCCEMRMGEGAGLVRVSLRIVDAPGYGDEMDVEKSFRRVSDFIENEFEKAIALEAAEVRPGYREMDAASGVDAVLYFIAPHRLKKLDIEFLTRIHRRASVLPIISKADTMTVNELSQFRKEVQAGLDRAHIRTFAGPFAVICCAVSQKEGQVNYGRGRHYPWGVALSDDPVHSDLPLLRQTLLTDGLLDLHNERSNKFEEYRRQKVRNTRRSRTSILGSLARLQRWAIGIAIHTLVGVAVFRGIQSNIHHSRSHENEDDVGKLLTEERGRGFFGRKFQPEEPPKKAGLFRRIP